MSEPSDLPPPARPPLGDVPPRLGDQPPAPPAKRHANWTLRLVLVLVGVLAVGALYVVIVAFLPRWWSQRIGGASDGHFTTGIALGLVVGGFFTALALVALAGVFKRGRSWGTRLALLLIAFLLSVPNLLTLWIVLGGGSAAHAGERTMDVDAPGFRGATLAGVILGALFFAFLWWVLLSRRRRKRQVGRLKAEIAQRDAQAAAAAQVEDTPPHPLGPGGLPKDH